MNERFGGIDTNNNHGSMSWTYSLGFRNIAKLFDDGQMLWKRILARLALFARHVGSRFVDQLLRFGLRFEPSLLKLFL